MGKIRFTLITIVLLSIASKLLANQSALNVFDYKVNIEPDIQKRHLKGSVFIKFQLPLNEYLVVLNAGNLQIDSIASNSVMNFTRNGEELVLELNAKRKEVEEVLIYYHGNPTKGLVFDQENNQAYTVYFTCNWMICHDAPSDKAKIELNILVPKGQDCIANGQLIKKVEIKEKVLYKWSQNLEVPTYTFGFVIGKFQQDKMLYNEVIINNYAQNYSLKELNRIFKETSQMMAFFEEKSGITFPQDTYSQVLIGNHYQEMSGFAILKKSYGELVLKDSTETNLISHELAHQWWGNMITCKSWNHFWLNEGFATFMSAAYNEHRFGKEKYQDNIDAYFNIYNNIKLNGDDKPLVFNDWSNPSKNDRNLVYFKGAYTLHLLRIELGDEAFWNGIKYFSQTYYGKSVTTKDFQLAMEKSSNKPLDSFFHKWIY